MVSRREFMAKTAESTHVRAQVWWERAFLSEKGMPLSVPVCNGVYLLFWRVDVFYRIFACSGRVWWAPLCWWILIKMIFQNGFLTIWMDNTFNFTLLWLSDTIFKLLHLKISQMLIMPWHKLFMPIFQYRVRFPCESLVLLCFWWCSPS